MVLYDNDMQKESFKNYLNIKENSLEDSIYVSENLALDKISKVKPQIIMVSLLEDAGEKVKLMEDILSHYNE